MKKLFPKKKSGATPTERADLKNSINQIRIGIKKYDRIAREYKIKAKQALAEGNTRLAKNYLLRRQRALQNLDRFQGFIIKLERQSDAIESAETIKVMGETMKTTTASLQKSVKELNPEAIMELNEESEEAIAYLDESAEIMADTIDLDADIEIDAELDELTAELAFEQEGGLPATPGTKVTSPSEEGYIVDLEEEQSQSDKLKKELEQLQKELDI